MRHLRGARGLLCTLPVGTLSFGTIYKFPKVLLHPQEHRREENRGCFIAPALHWIFSLARAIPNYWIIKFKAVLLLERHRLASVIPRRHCLLCKRRNWTMLSPLMDQNNLGHSNFLSKHLLSINSSYLSANRYIKLCRNMTITESHSTLWYRHLLLQCVIFILHPISFNRS